MRLAVEGMACLGSFGDDARALVRQTRDLFAAEDGQQEHAENFLPAAGEAPGIDITRGPKAETSGLTNFFPARALRQMDHFTRMALLCACRTLDDAGFSVAEGGQSLPEDTGIVLVSGYGPSSPTFQFLDSIMEHGELMASPLSFSHSVHNIPAASIAIRLGLSGPCLSLCQTACPVTAGLLAALAWLEEGRAERILLGAVDEHTPLLARVSGRLAAQRRSGFRRRFFLGEGAAFFVLSKDMTRARRGVITDICQSTLPESAGWRQRLCEESMNGQGRDAFTAGRIFASGALGCVARPGVTQAAAVYGNIPVAQAFDAVCALMHTPQKNPGEGTLCISFDTQGQTGSFIAVPAEKTDSKPE